MKVYAILLCLTLVVHGVNAQQTVGFFSRTSASEDGYVLFAPITSNNTYLIDKCGKSVHTWTASRKPGQSVYLLEDGSLLRPANAGNSTFTSGGSGGIIERYDWNGSLLWSYSISSATECQHHDVCRLPNGNVLAIVWESKTSAAAIAAGRNPALLGATLWSEKIVELQPAGTSGGTIVWEWHVWDHLVQEHDNTKPNYAVVSAHPELVNLNYSSGMAANADWLHINSVAYNAALDQVMVSVHNFSELWIIDHSTTTAQAATHAGGVRAKGGDLLYRWGNPITYGRGTTADRVLYAQHNAQWIAAGLPDSGKIMVFNNGQGRPGGNYSTVDVLAPAVDVSGNYTSGSSAAYGPAALSWQYKDATPTDFYAQNISGAQRLSSGNTLICEGTTGRLFEVDAAGNMVWKYVNPVTPSGPVRQGIAVTQNAVFRCTQYSASYAGLAGKTLTPGVPIEQNPLSYNCAMGATGVVSQQAIDDGLGIVNPFGNALIIHASRDVSNVSIVLTDIRGAVCGNWTDVQLHQGGAIRLETGSMLSAGIYHLQISAIGYRKRLILQHQL